MLVFSAYKGNLSLYYTLNNLAWDLEITGAAWQVAKRDI